MISAVLTTVIPKRIAIVLALALAVACHRDEPAAGGQPLSHWVREARLVSFFSFWNSTKDERRAEAFRRLKEIGEPAVPALVRLLRDESTPVSGDALNALASLGPRARAAVPDLVAMLQDRDGTKRSYAASILGAIGPDAAAAVPALTAMLRDPNRGLARMAAAALARIGGPAVLGDAVRSADPRLRESGFAGVASARRDLASTREYVEAAMADASDAVRARGIELLSDRRADDLEALSEFLVRGLNDPSGVVRTTAQRIFQTSLQHVVTPGLLAAVLAGGDPGSRADAAWHLQFHMSSSPAPPGFQQASNAPPDVLSALRGALDDTDIRVRIYAARTLAVTHADDAPRIAAFLRDQLPAAPDDIRLRGAVALYGLTHRVDDVRAAFERGLQSTDWSLRMETLGELIKLGKDSRTFLDDVERLRSDASREVSERARRIADFIQRQAS